MTATSTETQWPPLRRAERTVLVADVVESVRLMEQDEDDAVRRWQAFVGEVVTTLLPQCGGRLVKSLGDGLMVEFETVHPAIQCAIAMHSTAARFNQGQPSERRIWLRIGAHSGEVIADAFDIHGKAVNLTARIAALAGPGETVVTSDVRDRLTPGLDVDVEDLGDCHLKHVAEPVRAYRLASAEGSPMNEPAAGPAAELRPAIAVVPLSPRGDDPRLPIVGEALVDEVINALSRTADVRVISRLSTSAFRDRPDLLGAVRRHLRANYLVTGTCQFEGSAVRVHVELVEVANAQVLWSETLVEPVDSAVGADSELARLISLRVSVAVLANELSLAQTKPLPNLGAYTMLLGGVMLLHRFSPRDFDRSREVLESLTQRVPRHATPWAWLARWHDLRVFQGWSADPKRDREQALALSDHALQLDPNSSIALTTAGAVHSTLMKDLDKGIALYRQAIDCNPNEPLAWLLLGAAHSFRGEGDEAVFASDRALQLSPVDPMRFFYDALAASSALAAGQYGRATELALRSLRANRTHLSTYRVLAIAQCLAGDVAAARETVAQLLRLDPDFTVEGFLSRSPGGGYAIAQTFARALQEAGLPPGRQTEH